MSNSLGLLGVGLILGGLTGFVVAAGNGITLEGHEHGAGGHAAMGHGADGHGAADHAALHAQMVTLPAGAPRPAVDLQVDKDPVAGWNLKVTTQNFTFAPDQASGDHVLGQGHAHIYVNGEKKARLYGPWFHLASLPKGTNTLTVTLNANDHRSYSVNGSPIQQEIKLRVE